MFNTFVLGMALTVGQGNPIPVQLPTGPAPDAPGSIAPRRIPDSAPTIAVPGSRVISTPGKVTVYPIAEGEQAPAPAAPKAAAEAPKAEEPKKEEEDKRGYFMKMLDGTSAGTCLQKKGVEVSGWLQGAYTKSHATNTPSNLPVTWNDRANQFLLHQAWLRIAKPLDTESKEISTGFNLDLMFGSDYRFMLQRGFYNSQLQNSQGTQNIYGADMPQAYVNAYLPSLFEGTEVRLGKFFTPFGYESLEGPTTPLLSRSYAFNWAPPFTHWGAMAIANLDTNWQATVGVVNGNDVMIGDPAETWRGLAKIAYASDDKKTNIALATSLGHGKFNVGQRFEPATLALAYEPAGRNNINVFDLTFSQELSDELTTAFEAIYGYQTGVPANVLGGLIDTSKSAGQSGTAQWLSFVKYFLYKFNDSVTGVARAECFQDFQGQRTGFEGVYWAGTAGLRITPTDCLLIRPEVRYDYNGYTRSFDGGTKFGLTTAAIDVILKF